jgi:uncharacterized protein involved in exopolysaccharide biosynthesis
MNPRDYIKNIARYWWVIALAIIAGGVGAFAMDAVRKPEYSGSARVMVRPSASLNDSRTLVDLVGQIGARYVTGTYAQTFSSEQVTVAAQKAAGLSLEQADRYPLQANVLPDTVVIELSGTGPDPAMLARYLDATVNATVKQTNSLFGVMELQPLEAAKVPPTPTSPRPVRDLTLGLVLGLLVGSLLAWTFAYMRELRLAAEKAQVSQSFWATQADWDERMKSGQPGTTGSRLG